ncbi:MAG: iron-sulfur cluster insertion protein ErpA [Hyphomicrobiaceae bacterium]
MTTETLAPDVRVTERAARRICEIVAAEPSSRLLRVSVEGGGCSGFQYKFDLIEQAEPDDLLIERDGASVAIDPISLTFMSGSEIDFVDDLIGASFQIRNPNATAACGCGTSFTI